MAEENVLVPMTKTGNVTQLREFEEVDSDCNVGEGGRRAGS